MRIGIDLGGTKIELVAIDDVGDIVHRRRVATPTGDYAGTLAAIAQLVTTAEAELGPAESIGVGTPGAIDPVTGLAKNANSVALNGQPLDRDIEAELQRPIRLANDADCFAVSEARDGAGSGADPVFGVILGTGVGGGVVAGGRLVRGPNRISGEWGHNPLPWPAEGELPGPACYCGRFGCIETFVSGPGLAADHGRHNPGATPVTAAEIAAAAGSGDPAAVATMDRYHDRLARALSHVINVLDPAVIVLGGGASNIDSLYEAVPALWAEYVFSEVVLTKLVPAAHGDSSGVRGAAWLWDS